MLFVDFEVKAFIVWSKGQKDSLDFRAELPPHYDLLDIPLNPITEKEKISKIYFKKENQKKVLKRWPSAE